MRAHNHVLTAFKDRVNEISFNVVKLVDGKLKPYSLTHAGVVRLEVIVMGTEPDVLISSDTDDVVFSHDEVTIKFGSLNVEAGPYDLEVVAYKDDGLAITIFGKGLVDAISIQMRE